MELDLVELDSLDPRSAYSEWDTVVGVSIVFESAMW